jgi:beta-galactosidase
MTSPHSAITPDINMREPMSSIRRSPFLDLDGTWIFQLLSEQSVDPVESAWTEVAVPSLWTMDSRFGHPHYTNIDMPFDASPPFAPADNPVGVYRRHFRAPEPTEDRIILQVGAAEGHLTARVNGLLVGVSTDSHLHADFDITDALVEGENEIELRVQRWSDESYLEDQDQWWQSGISRSVSLHVEPRVRLTDVRVHADYDTEARSGSLRAQIFTNALASGGNVDYTVRMRILGSQYEAPIGGRPASQVMAPAVADRSQRMPRSLPDDIPDILSVLAAGGEPSPEFSVVLEQIVAQAASPAPLPGSAQLESADLAVEPWSAEQPHLEDLIIELLDPSGSVVDAAEFRIGFRKVEVVGRDLLVNGERILIQGVNRHDVDPSTGRVMTRERMRDELSLLKRFNFNAIRTSHYPNDPYFLDLCDEYGFYVVDEANVEAHSYTTTIADDPHYLLPIVERVKRMVLRDRNHPSIIIWSLGNETGYGAAHDAAAGWLRRADPTRPVQYEGAIAADWHGGRAASDIVCPMYPSFPGLVSYAQHPLADRPLIACEYAFALGNSLGGLSRYWELFESTPGLQGGFIWQFADHALDPEGEGRYRYGGDFGDEPNDGSFLLCGVVFADLTPKPALYEARGLFSPIRIVSGVDEALAGTVRVRSRRHFADLSDLAFGVRVETRTGASAAIPLPIDLGPGQEGSFCLPPELLARLQESGALALTLVVTLRHDTAWAPSGTELSAHQIQLPRSARQLPTPGPATGAVPMDGEGGLRHPLLASPPQLSLWRAQIDHDASIGLDGRFEKSGMFRLDLEKFDIRQEDGETVVERSFRGAFGDLILHHTRSRMVGPGDYVFDEQVELADGLSDLLRVGLRFVLVSGIEEVAWTGLGPWENYPDRRSSALLGRWSATVDELATPYLTPQENGARGGIDEYTLSGPAGRVDIAAGAPLSITTSRHSIEALEQADHWWELPSSEATHVSVDIAQRGVGTGALGPDTLREHRLTDQKYRWQWRLRLE